MKPLVLSGLPGAGKSTLAPRVAARLGVSCSDLDDRVARRVGTSLPAWIRAHGESAFRELERVELLRWLDARDASVLAVGGGALRERDVRHRVLATARVVTLDAPDAVLAGRVQAQASTRPLLAEGGAEQIARLREARAEGYAECHQRVSTAEPIEAVVDEIVRHAMHRGLVVPLGVRSYVVELVRDGGWSRVEAWLASLGRRGEVWLDAGARTAFGAVTRAHIGEGGEGAKCIEHVLELWRAFAACGWTREDRVVAVGGGAWLDAVGFAAATYQRGVPWIAVPTTLLAMVDAAIGGKTALDLDGAKNLVGAFHQPERVIVDVSLLRTLDHRAWRSGTAELVKALWLDGEESVAWLERNLESFVARDVAVVEEAVERAARTKITYVSRDEHDHGARHALNFGHTFAHVIEAVEADGVPSHGEAVALGMLAAMHVAEAAGRVGVQRRRLEALLRALGLPTEVAVAARSLRIDRIFADKKRSADALRYVLAEAPGQVSVVPMSVDVILNRWRSLA